MKNEDGKTTMMDRAQRRARALRGAQIQGDIRQILFDEWDLIGMDDRLPNDEYDCCVAPVYRALVEGASKDQLMFLLSSLEPHFGCSWRAPFAVKRNTARRLRSLNIQLIDKSAS